MSLIFVFLLLLRAHGGACIGTLVLSSLKMSWSQLAGRPKSRTAACARAAILSTIVKAPLYQVSGVLVGTSFVSVISLVQHRAGATPLSLEPHTTLLHAGAVPCSRLGALRLVVVEVYRRWLLAAADV